MKYNHNTENDVADYYDNNTARFMRFGNRNTSGTIHRRLYSSKKQNQEPTHFSDTIVLDLIKKTAAGRILDLGCGIGASIRYLHNKYKAEYSGITLSPVQHKIAADYNTEIELADYLDTDWYRGRKAYDIIYAIESLQHNPDHHILLNNLRGIMTRSSKLVIIDDFLINKDNSEGSNKLLIKRFKKHWHAHGFISVQDFVDIADSSGFKLLEMSNLTHFMKKPVINRYFRAAVLSLLSVLPFKSSFLDNIIGGGSLILLQQLKLSGYYKLVLSINGE